jgi:hypothetical protein
MRIGGLSTENATASAFRGGSTVWMSFGPAELAEVWLPES